MINAQNIRIFKLTYPEFSRFRGPAVSCFYEVGWVGKEEEHAAIISIWVKHFVQNSGVGRLCDAV